MTAALKAERVHQRYAARTALFPLDLELEAGERLAVLGDNGAGKTTLLRILATASRPSGGKVWLRGLDTLKDRPAARRLVGHVGHRLGLYPVLSVMENLRFFARLRGLPPGVEAAALERLGLTKVAATPAGELSRGMQQRLGLAISLIHEPPVWVIDEPDASLDQGGRDLLGGLMEGRTVVMATHDRELAGRLCSRALVLAGGREVRVPPRLEVVGE